MCNSLAHPENEKMGREWSGEPTANVRFVQVESQLHFNLAFIQTEANLRVVAAHGTKSVLCLPNRRERETTGETNPSQLQVGRGPSFLSKATRILGRVRPWPSAHTMYCTFPKSQMTYAMYNNYHNSSTRFCNCTTSISSRSSDSSKQRLATMSWIRTIRFTSS